MYLYSYLSTHSISRVVARSDWEQFEVRLTMTIEWTQRYTPRPWSSDFGDALGGHDRVNSEMQWEAVIEQDWRCTLRPWSSELRDALGGRVWESWRCTLSPRLSELRDALRGRDWASWKINSDSEIEYTQRCTRGQWSTWPSETGDALWGGDRASLEMQLETEIEWTQRCTARPWSSEFGCAIRSRGGRWEAREVLRLYSSVSWLETVGMWRGDFTFEGLMENWLMAVDR